MLFEVFFDTPESDSKTTNQQQAIGGQVFLCWMAERYACMR